LPFNKNIYKIFIMKIASVFILLLTIGFASCHKQHIDNSIKGDYMVIGWTGGFAGLAVHNY
jgi:hypothetical protein